MRFAAFPPGPGFRWKLVPSPVPTPSPKLTGAQTR